MLLRNSFLIVEEKWKERINKLNLQVEDFFKPELDLVNQIVKRDSTQHLQLDESIEATGQLFEKIKTQATNIDSSLQKHVDALKTAAIKKLEILEKKMLRAEKKKFVAQQRQLHIIKQQLFPRNGLQERVENIAPFYARYGEEIIHQLYLKSSTLQQEFTVLTIQ